MHVAMQLKVPIDDATSVVDRLSKLRAMNTYELNDAKHGPSQAVVDQLVSRGKKLTPNNYMRLVIEEGVAALAKVKDKDLLLRLAEDGVARGRPRGR